MMLDAALFCAGELANVEIEYLEEAVKKLEPPSDTK
jgi:hypothetical protein